MRGKRVRGREIGRERGRERESKGKNVKESEEGGREREMGEN